MLKSINLRTALSVAVLTFSMNAHAHLVSTRFGELYSGMLHPLLALNHIVPWLGLGLLGAIVGKHSARWALAYFPAAVFIGVIIGNYAPDWGFVRFINLASFVILGGLVVTNVKLKTVTFIGLVIALGLSHGYGNAAAELSGNAMWLYATGVMLSAYLVVALVTAGAYSLHAKQWGKIAVRAAGSWIVAIGLVFGGFTLFASS